MKAVYCNAADVKQVVRLGFESEGNIVDKKSQNALIVWAAAIAGGAGGWWAGARVGASMGLHLSPWGAAAGAVAGAMLSKMILEEQLEFSSTTPDEMFDR